MRNVERHLNHRVQHGQLVIAALTPEAGQKVHFRLTLLHVNDLSQSEAVGKFRRNRLSLGTVGASGKNSGGKKGGSSVDGGFVHGFPP